MKPSRRRKHGATSPKKGLSNERERPPTRRSYLPRIDPSFVIKAKSTRSLTQQIAKTESTRPQLEMHCTFNKLKTELRSLQRGAAEDLLRIKNEMNLGLNTTYHRLTNSVTQLHLSVDEFHRRSIAFNDHPAFDKAAQLHSQLIIQKQKTNKGGSSPNKQKKKKKVRRLPPISDAVKKALAAGSTNTNNGFISFATSSSSSSSNSLPPLKSQLIPAVPLRKPVPKDRLDIINQYNRFIQNHLPNPPSQSQLTKFYDDCEEWCDDHNIKVDRRTIRNWTSNNKTTTTTALHTGTVGRPTGINTARMTKVIEDVETHMTKTGRAPFVDSVENRLAHEHARSAALRGTQAGILSSSLKRKMKLVAETQTRTVPKPDSACQTNPRKKSECFRNALNMFHAKRAAQRGPRPGVPRPVSEANPSIRGLIINYDEVTTVVGNNHNKRYKVMVVYDSDEHVKAYNTAGRNLPTRIVLFVLGSADGEMDFLITVTLKEYDVFLQEEGVPICDANQNIFKKVISIGPSRRPIEIRFIRPGTKEAEIYHDSYHNFVLPCIALRRQYWATQLGINLNDPIAVNKSLWSSISSDGAGTNLKMVVRDAISGGCAERGEAHLKGPSSSTGNEGMGQTADRATCFRDFKKTLTSRLNEYHMLFNSNMKSLPDYDPNENVELGPNENQMETEGDEIDYTVLQASSFWNGFTEDPVIIDLEASLKGQNATMGFKLVKLPLLQRFIFVFKETIDSVWAGSKWTKACRDLGEYPSNAALAIMTCSDFKRQTPEDRKMIMSQKELDWQYEQVLQYGFIRDVAMCLRGAEFTLTFLSAENIVAAAGSIVSQNIFTLTFLSQDTLHKVGTLVTQGNNKGILTKKLNGPGMTTLIISAKEGVKFNMTEDIDLNPDSEDDFDTIPGTNLLTITNTSISGTLKRALGGPSTSLIVSNPTGTFVSTSSTTVGKVTINSTNISSCVKSKQGYPPGKYVDENGERVSRDESALGQMTAVLLTQGSIKKQAEADATEALRVSNLDVLWYAMDAWKVAMELARGNKLIAEIIAAKGTENVSPKSKLNVKHLLEALRAVGENDTGKKTALVIRLDAYIIATYGDYESSSEEEDDDDDDDMEQEESEEEDEEDDDMEQEEEETQISCDTCLGWFDLPKVTGTLLVDIENEEEWFCQMCTWDDRINAETCAERTKLRMALENDENDDNEKSDSKE